MSRKLIRLLCLAATSVGMMLDCHAAIAAVAPGAASAPGAPGAAAPASASGAAAALAPGAKALFYGVGDAVLVTPSAPARVNSFALARSPRPVAAHSRAVRTARPGAGRHGRAWAMRASVLLERSDGALHEVPPSFRFRSGDRLRLAFEGSHSGYFYLVGHGSSGALRVLSAANGVDARVRARHSYVFPRAQGSVFQMDAHAGQEVLYAVLCERPIATLRIADNRQVDLDVQVPPRQRGEVTPASFAHASRDILVEDDALAAYAAAPAAPAGEDAPHMVALRIALRHD